MFLYMTHSLREYLGGRLTFRMGIARMIGVDQSLGDPNSFGASIVYALPFVVPFWLTQPSLRVRGLIGIYVTLSMVCIGLTGSRSAFVGLLLCMLVMIARSRWRGRLALGAILAAPLLWAALPPALQTRFETIIHPEVGPANAQVSGEGRLEGLQIGFQLWSQFPATGCGPGVWRPATGRLIESHNLYGQLVGEMGTVGLVAFAAILICFWINLRWIRRAYQAHPEWGHDFLYHCSRAVGWGVLLLLFEGNFGHNLFRFSWLWYGGFLIVARYCVEQRLAAAYYLTCHSPAYRWAVLSRFYDRAAYSPG
jgi:O-antigen ligase